MDDERLPNRMLFPVLGIAINLCLGNLYAWSVFRIPLQKAYGWSAFEATVPFAISVSICFQSASGMSSDRTMRVLSTSTIGKPVAGSNAGSNSASLLGPKT